MNWIGHFFGIDNPGSSPFYNFWSGAGSDIGEIVIIGAIYAWIRRANCGVKGCWRIGLRKVPGTEHIVCHRHHPLQQPTYEQVLADHRAANPPTRPEGAQLDVRN